MRRNARLIVHCLPSTTINGSSDDQFPTSSIGLVWNENADWFLNSKKKKIVLHFVNKYEKKKLLSEYMGIIFVYIHASPEDVLPTLWMV